MRCFMFCLVVVIFSTFFIPQLAEGWHPPASSRVIHGEICEIDTVQRKVRITSRDGIDILELTDEALILRHGSPVSLNAARPITDGCYQEGIFYLNSRGLVELMYIHYLVYEELVEDRPSLKWVDVFGQVKAVEQL